jgi:hypothetical protein
MFVLLTSFKPSIPQDKGDVYSKLSKNVSASSRGGTERMDKGLRVV